MSIKRREFLVAATAMVVAGCESSDQILSHRPRPDWLGHSGALANSRSRGAGHYSPLPRSAPKKPNPVVMTPLKKVPVRPSYKQVGLVSVLSRSQWTRSRPNMSKINAMGAIHKITIHHTGLGVFTDKSYRGTQKYLELIRSSHTKGRGWSDIGYHFAIDPNGRVWECRNLKYQGAHVRSNNENNIGVLMLGNFEKQSPSKQQLASMRAFVRQLRKKYGVSVSRIKSHREYNRTACPGRRLQPYVVKYRKNGYFA